MQTARVLIVGNYGAGNLGDDAILGGILEDLDSLGIDFKVFAFSGNFKTSSKIYERVHLLPFPKMGWRGNLKKTQNPFPEVDLIIFGGGALFADDESWKAPFFWGRLARLFQREKIPYFIYGQSLGPLHHCFSKVYSRKAFEKAQAVHLRDQDSLLRLNNWWKGQAVYGSDLACSWLREHVPSAIQRKNRFLLCLRKWPKDDAEGLVRIVQLAQSFASKHQVCLELLLMDTSRPKERHFLKTLGLPLHEPQSAQEALELISSSQFLCTLRLHPGIFAAASKTPFLALSSSLKIQNFWQSQKLSEHCTSLASFTENDLERTFSKIPSFNLKPLVETNQAFLKQAFEEL